MTLKHIRNTAGLLLVAAGLAFSLLLYYAHRTQLEAEACMGDIRTLRVGKSPFHDVTSFQRKYVRYLRNKSQVCDSEDCPVTVEFRNWLAFLTLHDTRIQPSVVFRAGSLETVYVGAQCAGVTRELSPFMLMVTQSLRSAPGLHGGAARFWQRLCFRPWR